MTGFLATPTMRDIELLQMTCEELGRDINKLHARIDALEKLIKDHHHMVNVPGQLTTTTYDSNMRLF